MEIKQEKDEELFSYIVKEEYSYENSASLPSAPGVRIVENRTNIIQMAYQCDVCGKHYASLKVLNDHALLHVNDKYVYCAHCYSGFRTKNSLKLHMSSHMKESLSCNICHKKMKDNFALGNHLWRHSLEKHYKCNYCGDQFVYKTLLDQHIKLSHTGYMATNAKPVSSTKAPRKGLYPCPHCKRKLLTKEKYKIHLTCHTKKFPDGSFECEKCSKTFRLKSYLNVHMLRHIKPDDRPFACHFCPKKFINKSLLKDHVVKHMLNFQSCPYCDMVFAKTKQFREHVEGEHPGLPTVIAGASLTCTICKEVYDNRGELKEHIKTHCALNHPKICPHCKKKCCGRTRLKEHIKRFHNESTEKTYSMPLILNWSYTCDFCNRRFRSESLYKSHMRTHTEGDELFQFSRVFECEICKKQFKERCDLVQHMQAHTRASRRKIDKKYSCRICKKKFSSKLTLKKHKMEHEGGNSTKECPDCKGFGYICN